MRRTCSQALSMNDRRRELYKYSVSLCIYTLRHKKEPTYFLCNFVKNQRISMYFSMLDSKRTIHVMV